MSSKIKKTGRRTSLIRSLLPSLPSLKSTTSKSSGSTHLPINTKTESSKKLDRGRFGYGVKNKKAYNSFLKILCDQGILKQKKECATIITLEKNEKREAPKPLILEEAQKKYPPKQLLTFFYMTMCSNTTLAFEFYKFFSLFLQNHISLDDNELAQLFKIVEDLLKEERLPLEYSEKCFPLESRFSPFFELKYQFVLKSLEYFLKNTKKVIDKPLFYNMIKTILELTHENFVLKRSSQNNDLIEKEFKNIQMRVLRFFIQTVIKRMNDKKFIDSTINQTAPYMCIKLILKNELIQNMSSFNKTTLVLSDELIQSFATDVLELNNQLSFFKITDNIILEIYELILSSPRINFDSKSRCWKQIKTNLSSQKELTIERGEEGLFFRLFFLLYNQQKNFLQERQYIEAIILSLLQKKSKIKFSSEKSPYMYFNFWAILFSIHETQKKSICDERSKKQTIASKIMQEILNTINKNFFKSLDCKSQIIALDILSVLLKTSTKAVVLIKRLCEGTHRNTNVLTGLNFALCTMLSTTKNDKNIKTAFFNLTKIASSPYLKPNVFYINNLDNLLLKIESETIKIPPNCKAEFEKFVISLMTNLSKWKKELKETKHAELEIYKIFRDTSSLTEKSTFYGVEINGEKLVATDGYTIEQNLLYEQYQIKLNNSCKRFLSEGAKTKINNLLKKQKEEEEEETEGEN